MFRLSALRLFSVGMPSMYSGNSIVGCFALTVQSNNACQD